MSKNIVLCADGTGSKGGYGSDSNVYKIYNAIDIHNKKNPQITFYDNGVGTAKNKLMRVLAGAFGFGFRCDVLDLYEYLAKNYKSGDQVYLFGFSHGAATLRAFAGFIATCGLVNGKELDKHELKCRVKEAFQAYIRLRKRHLRVGERGFVSERDKFLTQNFEKKSHGIIPIKFIGLWDTVPFMVFPHKWDITGIFMFPLNMYFMVLDRATDLVFPHNFYNYTLTGNVQYAYQALAIDEERASFWPKVWIERKDHTGCVEQVWFAGMHSNVGGGQCQQTGMLKIAIERIMSAVTAIVGIESHRPGLANIALEWMMDKSKKHGLVFKDGTLKKVHDDANVHDRIYNSRDGLGIIYRYHPREIERICKGSLKDTIKIHESVIERMRRNTADYSPGLLPINFEIVDNEGVAKEVTSETNNKDREMLQRKIKWWIFLRKWLYGLFFESTLAIVFLIWWWKDTQLDYLKPQCVSDCARKSTESPEQLTEYIAEGLTYILPDFCNGAITKAVIQCPWYFLVTILLFCFSLQLRTFFKVRTDRLCEELRKNVLASLVPVQEGENKEDKKDNTL
jgi:hypothetical protein